MKWTDRTNWLPSEKAKTYKLHLEATKKISGLKQGGDMRQREKNGANHSPLSHAATKGGNREIAAKKFGMSGKMLDTYIKLNDLIPGLMDMADEERIPVASAFRLAFIPQERQEKLLALLRENPDVKINPLDAQDLRNCGEERWNAILGIGVPKTAREKLIRFSVPASQLPEGAEKYLKDTELLARIAEIVTKYMSQKAAE